MHFNLCEAANELLTLLTWPLVLKCFLASWYHKFCINLEYVELNLKVPEDTEEPEAEESKEEEEAAEEVPSEEETWEDKEGIWQAPVFLFPLWHSSQSQ